MTVSMERVKGQMPSGMPTRLGGDARSVPAHECAAHEARALKLGYDMILVRECSWKLCITRCAWRLCWRWLVVVHGLILKVPGCYCTSKPSFAAWLA